MDNNNIALHAVCIRKHPKKNQDPLTAEQAREMAQSMLPTKKKALLRDRKSTYHFRHISKQKFEPRSLKTKRVNNKVSLTYGTLKPEHRHLEGRGFLDYFKKKAQAVGTTVTNAIQDTKDYFSPRLDDYNNKSKRTIKELGNIQVQSMQIYRTPIAGFIEPVLNAVSLGKWNELKKKYAFDKMFHLALVCNVGSKNVMCQKLSHVDVTTSYKTNKNTEVHQIDLQGKKFTVYEMLQKARQEQGDNKFFAYDAFANNCQYFVSYLLKAEGLYSDAAKQFLFQDISGIVKELPEYVKRFARGVTDLDATINKVTGGKFIKKEKKNLRGGGGFGMENKKSLLRLAL